jgi:hypothetical protein
MGDATSNAAIVEKARSLYECREAIDFNHDVLLVCVNRVYIHSCCVNVTRDISKFLAFDLEEIPTQSLPVWMKGMEPSLGPHPLRWTLRTKLRNSFVSPLFRIGLRRLGDVLCTGIGR